MEIGKIGNKLGSVQADLIAKDVSSTRSPVASGEEVAAVQGTDKVALSAVTQNLVNTPNAVPQEGVRAEKIQEIRQAIQRGEFHVSAQVVADRMINDSAELVETLFGRGAG